MSNFFHSFLCIVHIYCTAFSFTGSDKVTLKKVLIFYMKCETMYPRHQDGILLIFSIWKSPTTLLDHTEQSESLQLWSMLSGYSRPFSYRVSLFLLFLILRLRIQSIVTKCLILSSFRMSLRLFIMNARIVLFIIRTGSKPPCDRLLLISNNMTLEKFHALYPRYPIADAILELGYTDTSFINNI